MAARVPNMAKTSSPQIKPANLPATAVPEAIRKLKLRYREFEEAPPEGYEGNLSDLAQSLCIKLDSTLVEVFGHNTLEYKNTRAHSYDFSLNRLSVSPHGHPRHELVDAFNEGRLRAKSRITAMIQLLSERLDDSGETGVARALRAYEGLALHSEIERAAGALYRDGHYANAIEDAVKSLNALVRLRSGLDADGMTLMERVFSPTSPILKFNDLQTQTDRDEQKGFMVLFSGAVVGLRNPRAHAIIQDDPERALEFIAFVSLLAKLLDGAKK
jgi:uncharacterized protein (TIGR02391 family)